MVMRRGRKGLEWTPGQLKDLRKLNVANFCNKYGISKSTVYRKRIEVGIVEVLRVWTPEMDKLILETDMTDSAKMLEIPVKAVRKRLDELGEQPKKPIRGIKYTEEFIRRMLSEHGSTRHVASFLGISQQRVCNICKNLGIKLESKKDRD